ncbi:MAG: GGDEF domain-containing protein [Pseudomonadota bacterium]
MKTRPSPDLAHAVVQSIVVLTEQRDQRSLIQSLIASLGEMLASAESWLLDVPAELDEPLEFTVAHGRATALPAEILDFGRQLPNPDELNAYLHGETVYQVIRLRDAERDRMQLLVLAQPHWTEPERLLLRGMTRVYQNFVELLYDSEKDTLTGLFNRRKLEAKLKDFGLPPPAIRRQTDAQSGNYLAILDLDRFKRINDTYGHLIGDEVLLTFANILRRTLREDDLIFRYGGEEFVTLLGETTEAAVAAVLERVRRNVEAHDFPIVGHLTVSIGYAHLGRHNTPLDVLDKADRALYYAKENGRNQVWAFQRLVQEGKLDDVAHDGSIELF